ncbi:CxC2 domain-containing protein [Favolaschia claudopus]|uniref:CxC2 domain-containing protein n=1 Tax=Favolaschia claudopus TaxID=2862362 RepID=A0AAV9ZNL9_9AGAR
MHRRALRERKLNLLDVDDDYGGVDFTVIGDRGIYLSLDGYRREEELLNVSHKKRRLEPSNLDDQLALWIPVPDEDFNEDEARAPPSESATLGKRKQYVSTRDPMSLWRPLKGEFLTELLRHDGLGDDTADPRCAHCNCGFSASPSDRLRLFKCYECGQFLQCADCCLLNHKRTPLHVIQEWNGNFWVPRTLAELGLIYQLGHGGFSCPAPDSAVRNLTVIEEPIIHEIKIRYCKCSKSDDADNLEQLLRNGWYPATVIDPGTCATFRTLETYRLYNVVGNMNVRDFMTSVERATDPSASSGMTWLPDRYKQFGRVSRQWSFLLRLKRAGRGHDPQGVGSTSLGECAVRCWACPHDGRNLPDGWREVDPKYQFLYMLILAVDANFRLRNRIRVNELDDPSLGPGWGYWVEPESYREHLKNYVNETEISTCIAFAALLQKDTRMTTGLRVSGVGGCVCARHECMRPNGIGDLQKGERYANMDWIVLAALAGFSLLWLTISYDIGCQWKLHFPERMKQLPREMHLPLQDINIQFGLPVWHAASHNEDCQNQNSLSFRPGVGRSDGEGVERTWSGLNPAALSTKDAGTGVRADAMEAKIDNHNYLKNVGQGDALQRKLVIAIAERDRQVAGFKDVNKTVEKDVKVQWRKAIKDWEQDSTKPNPFILSRQDCPTETQVRLEVRKDEQNLGGGTAPLHGRSATAFLVAGIQLEDSQRRILAQLKGTALVSADRENKIQEWRHALYVKLNKFRNLQKIYMPGCAAVLENHEARRDPDAPPPKAEVVKLFMPSEMVAAMPGDPLHGCIAGLAEMEAKLRVAQCDNSLALLRSRLHAKRHLISFRNANIVGQNLSTRARTLIEEIGDRVESYANRYRKGREALISLKGADKYPHLRELKPEDVQLDGDAGESDSAARKKLAMIGAGRGARAPRNAPGTSRRLMSWIWTAPGALDEEAMHDSIRVEWAKSFARKTRWCEEVMLLREEMRRVLRYLGWQAEWWRGRVGLKEDLPMEAMSGLKAYALKQAAWHDRLGEFFRTKWNVPAVTVAQQLLAEEVSSADHLFSLE